MSENPFESPQADTGPVQGVISGKREDLRKVAAHQKGVLVCLLLTIFIVVGLRFVPPELALLLQIAYVVVGLAGVAFVFLLSRNVYNIGVAILLTVLMFIPCVSLLVLLVVNGKATTILKANGIRVGLLGARLADV